MFLVVCILTFKTFLVVYIMIMTGSLECWIVTGSVVPGVPGAGGYSGISCEGRPGLLSLIGISPL